MSRRPPRSPLFPYTTLFRTRRDRLSVVPPTPKTPQAARARVWPVRPIPPCASACHTPGAESWRCGRPHAPEPLPRRTPTTPLESASGLGGNSASARSIGESSACWVEPQALPWWSSSVLLPLTGLAPTVPTTAGRRHAAFPRSHQETLDPH